MSKTIAPYGAWKSPITSDLIVSKTIGLGFTALDGDDIYWQEFRPQEAGRHVIMRMDAQGKVQDLTPADMNARTRVHEYGGGAYCVHKGVVYFSNYNDQRIWRQEPGAEPYAITPAANLRFADYIVDAKRNRLICVQEDHSDASAEAKNTLVAISLDKPHAIETLSHGHDFYANPRLSPDGTKFAYLAWNHPNMPWDGCELWLVDLRADGDEESRVLIAGGKDESIFQPEWSPDGVLHFVSDRSGFWNLYACERAEIKALCPMEAEFGQPLWQMRRTTYGFVGPKRIFCTYTKDGDWHLAFLAGGKLEPIKSDFTDIESVNCLPKRAVFCAGAPNKLTQVVELDIAANKFRVLKKSSTMEIDPKYISVPTAVTFPTEGGTNAHGFFYKPANGDFEAPDSELPPLIVLSHGGPTSATSGALNLNFQYWTSRGFAILDVNYGGSTGYGRNYRLRLNGKWGIVDVDDCTNGALYLAKKGIVDKKRMSIAGGSAGGYTTLCALTFRDVFQAGSSRYGIGDLEAMTQDTHKFESRYLDNLVGKYPEEKHIYKERSPIHHIEKLACPAIFFQGLEDKVVPPNQAEMMVDALRKKGMPVAYVAFEGEQHGFRRAETIKRYLDGQLYFYSQIFGFTPADPIEPVQIENLAKAR